MEEHQIFVTVSNMFLRPVRTYKCSVNFFSQSFSVYLTKQNASLQRVHQCVPLRNIQHNHVQITLWSWSTLTCPVGTRWSGHVTLEPFSYQHVCSSSAALSPFFLLSFHVFCLYNSVPSFFSPLFQMSKTGTLFESFNAQDTVQTPTSCQMKLFLFYFLPKRYSQKEQARINNSWL